MGNEKNLWYKIRKGMRGLWRVQRFEDKLSLGIPDLGFVVLGEGVYPPLKKDRSFGFLELKRVKEFPKRAETPVRIPHKLHWKTQQAWAYNIGSLTGKVFLLLQVKNEHYLFDWKVMQKVGELTKYELGRWALFHWSGRMDYSRLRRLLADTYF